MNNVEVITIISKNLDAVIVSWNVGAQHIFGYTEIEAVGQPITILIPPELRDEEDRILARLRAGGQIDQYETIRVTKTGTKVDVSLSVSPIKDAAGTLLGFCKIAHDITERKRAERVLLETNQALEKQTSMQEARSYTFEETGPGEIDIEHSPPSRPVGAILRSERVCVYTASTG